MNLIIAFLLAATWDFPKDIAAEQYAELKNYYEGLFKRPEKHLPDIAALRRMIGADIPLLPLRPTKTAISDAGPYTVSMVEWPLTAIGNTPPTRGIVLNQVRFFGLLFEGKRGGKSVVLSPDPAQWSLGLQAARELARRGATVILPIFTRREALAQPYLDDRQWLFRLATQTGHHLLGAEVVELTSAANYLQSIHPATPITLIGIGDGSLAAKLAATIDTRFTTTRFAQPPPTLQPWKEPADKMIWNFPISLTKIDGSDDLQSLLQGEPEPDKPLPLDTVSILKIYTSHFIRWQAFFHNAALESYEVRKKAGQPSLSDYFELTGNYPKPTGDFDVRSVPVYDTAEVTGQRIRVRVYDGVNAYGILLIPKRLDPIKKHPLVFVQHGLAGKPEDALGVEDNPKADDVYRKFGLQLARRGFIVFAPMISTQSGLERNELVRRSHPLGLTPAGIERVKFSRLLDYFSTLPQVDANRFAFYGLSYGGYTALWTTPGEPRFKVVICSGHFNDWTTKTTDLTMGTSYMYYADHMDMFNHGMLRKFSHADLASLIMPRPFAVEMGDQDGVIVAPRGNAESELSLVMDRFKQQGVPERFAVFRFNGPHRIDGPATFDFLDRWLR